MITNNFNSHNGAEPGTLERLSAMAGIQGSYFDMTGKERMIGPDTMRDLLSAMGIRARTDEEIADSLKTLEEAPWRRALSPVAVIEEKEADTGIIQISACLPKDKSGDEVTMVLQKEDGSIMETKCSLLQENIEQTANIDGQEMARFKVAINSPGETGFHNVWLKDHEDEAMTLVLAPDKAYLPESLEKGERRWGVFSMIFELKSDRNWGIGDFKDLKEMVVEAAAAGASTVGINPIHAIHNPESQASPYYPGSRIFKNPLYISIEDAPGYTECTEIQQFVSDRAEEIRTLREREEIDTSSVSALKMEALEILYGNLANNDSPDKTEFDNYCADKGEQLERFATFQALREHFDGNTWYVWPEEYRNPEAVEVKDFADQNRERVNFFKYQQWVIDRQLSAVKETAEISGLECGIYGDLAVGMNPDGADAWAFNRCASHDCSIGAPPDMLGPQGQNWGLAVFTPQGLKDQAYKPLVDLLESTMESCGIMRMDHAMNIMRLFYIPAYKHASEGAYINYDMDEMLGVMKLLSHRHKCMLIGEDLGTVPMGFREKMAESGALSYKVQWWERKNERLHHPNDYPVLSLACVNTHDMAPLKAYWDGEDIKERKTLGLYPTQEDEAGHWSSRRQERQVMLNALRDTGMLPQGVSADNPDISYTEELGAAIHRYGISSNSFLLMVSADDLDSAVVSQNMPGTSEDQRPANWRQKLSRTPKELMDAPLMRQISKDLNCRTNEKLRSAITSLAQNRQQPPELNI